MAAALVLLALSLTFADARKAPVRSCPPGKFLRQVTAGHDVCNGCEENSFTTLPNQRECLVCDPNASFNAKDTGCTCNENYVDKSGAGDGSVCDLCPAGQQYADGVCEDCPAGTFSAIAGELCTSCSDPNASPNADSGATGCVCNTGFVGDGTTCEPAVP